MPTCPSSLTLLPRYPLALPFSLPSFILLAPSCSSSNYLCRHPSPSPPMQLADAIRSAPFLSLPLPSSRKVPSRFNLRDRPPPPLPSPPLLTPFQLPSSPFPSQGFSPFFRTHHRSFPPPHCTSFHPQPSLVSSLFRGYANGVISGLFFVVGLGFLNAGVTSHSTSTISRRLAER